MLDIEKYDEAVKFLHGKQFNEYDKDNFIRSCGFVREFLYKHSDKIIYFDVAILYDFISIVIRLSCDDKFIYCIQYNIKLNCDSRSEYYKLVHYETDDFSKLSYL